MIIKNKKPVGRWYHIKKNGYVKKYWIAAYSQLELPFVDSSDEILQNAHEKSIENTEEKYGVEIDNIEDIYKYKITVTEGATGGTTSLSASTVSVNSGLNLSFNIYPEINYYLSAYTVDNSSVLGDISDPSASTITTTIQNITDDKVIFVGFSPYGS